MKNNKHFFITIISVFTFLFVLAFWLLFLKGVFCLNYDNNKTIQQLVTIKYSATEIKAIEEEIQEGKTTISSLKKLCKLECLRKTEHGYYTVLLGSDNSKLFVFFDGTEIVTHVSFVKEFKSKGDYDSLKIGETTLDDVFSFDENTVDVSPSSFNVTIAVVKEGLIHIIYERMNTDDMTFLPSPVIKSISFYDDIGYLQLIEQYDCDGKLQYILPIDR